MEHGLGLGICTNQQVICASNKTSAYRNTSEDREWLSIVEKISVDCRKIRPLVIFRGAAPQSSWFEQDMLCARLDLYNI